MNYSLIIIVIIGMVSNNLIEIIIQRVQILKTDKSKKKKIISSNYSHLLNIIIIISIMVVKL